MLKIFVVLFTITNYSLDKQENYIQKIEGIDGRYRINENIESKYKILENLFKGELLEKLEENKYNIYEKLEILKNNIFLIENMDDNTGFNIRVSKLVNGGLMNDWLFEEF